MKNIFLISIFSFFYFITFSQTKDEINEIGTKLCECYTEILNKKDVTKENVEQLLGECMLNTMYSEMDEKTLKKLLKDPNKFNQLTLDLINITSQKCPEEGIKLNNISLGLVDNSFDQQQNQSLSGYIEEIITNDFTYVTVKSNNDIEKFLWLRPFEGDSYFLRDKNSLTGKYVKLEYIETKIYYPKLNEYIPRNEIISIKF